jgi:hypothetical protein
MQKRRVLVLRLKAKWWDEIASGRKVVEIRLRTEYWQKRLVGRQYDEIEIWKGYPAKTETDKCLVRRWAGFRESTITHEEFGPNPVDVFEIDVSKKVEDRQC